jgi:hypothetical protein
VDSNGGKIYDHIRRNVVGKFGTNVGMTAMGGNFVLILGEMYWGNLVLTSE